LQALSLEKPEETEEARIHRHRSGRGLTREVDWSPAQLEQREKRKADLLNRLFMASLQTSRFDEAYSALTRQPNAGLRHFALQSFVTTLVNQNRVRLLLGYPFANSNNEVDEVLSAMTKKTLNLNVAPQYHKVLYSFRINRGDYRGAAQVAFDRLERLKGDSEVTRSPEDQRLVEAYVLLINTLICVGKDEAWVIREGSGSDGLFNGSRRTSNGFGAAGVKRCIITVDDVRREYQDELDRLAALEQGKFAFTDDEVGDGMDVL
jgi:hypothetical protein